jgi:hypothetical protein
MNLVGPEVTVSTATKRSEEGEDCRGRWGADVGADEEDDAQGYGGCGGSTRADAGVKDVPQNCSHLLM